MGLEINRVGLLKLMKDFHILTGIRIVLFDTEYKEVLSYPLSDCNFCQVMKKTPATDKLCRRSDRRSFQKCQQENKLIIYHCHAGLIEACAPLREEKDVIGYLMFGQISDIPSASLLNQHLNSYLKSSEPNTDANTDWSVDIPLQTTEQIHAAAHIMEACTSFMIMSENVRLRRHNFITNIRQYLLLHLEESLTVNQIARDFGISRSKLYQTCEQYLGRGIGAYIHELRMERARELLKNTDLSVTDVALKCGYKDYNYFCRVFKREHGVSAGKYG